MHFIDCDFSAVGFTGAHITDCTFEVCRFSQTGFWHSRIESTSFLHCEMTDCAFGGMGGFIRQPNYFDRVCFESCDMRESAHSCEVYTSCSFDTCQLDEVNFMGAVFEQCKFKGELLDVSFRKRDTALSSKFAKDNSLLNCNFNEADVTWCQFLNLDIDPAIFGSNDDLFILPRGPLDWKEWLDSKLVRQDEGAKWFIGEKIRDSGTPAVESRKALLESFAPKEVQALEDICRAR